MGELSDRGTCCPGNMSGGNVEGGKVLHAAADDDDDDV